LDSIYKDDDGHILEWTNPIDRKKIEQQISDRLLERRIKHDTECIEAGLCTRCGKPITGILKKADTDMDVSREEYMYLLIYSKIDMCLNCIDKFLEDAKKLREF